MRFFIDKKKDIHNVIINDIGNVIIMWILNEKEPFETDEEYKIRIKKEGEYIEVFE